MSTPAQILVYGRDLPLLDTRCLLLQKTGCEAVIASDMAAAAQIVTDQHPDLLIICHTASPEEAKQLLDLNDSFSSSPKSIILTANRKGCAVADRGETVDVYKGPKALLSRVKDVLNLTSYTVA